MRADSRWIHCSPCSPASSASGTTSGGCERKRGTPSTVSVSFANACRLSRVANLLTLRRASWTRESGIFTFAAAARVWIMARRFSTSRREYHTCRLVITAKDVIAVR